MMVVIAIPAQACIQQGDEVRHWNMKACNILFIDGSHHS